MFVILVYDVAAVRNAKVLKTCRKYLSHVQKSVFEGTISEGKLKKLQGELEKVIHTEEDKVCVYKLESLRFTSKLQIGLCEQNDNFL